MHGEGERRTCPHCSPSSLGTPELKGPRNITSSNVDRFFDDGGQRFLFIEEKNEGEHLSEGQQKALRALAGQHGCTVRLARGERGHMDLLVIPPTGHLRAIFESGTFADYQRAVLQWFAATPAPKASPSWMDALAEAPYEPPPGIEREDWLAFDRAFTKVYARLNHP